MGHQSYKKISSGRHIETQPPMVRLSRRISPMRLVFMSVARKSPKAMAAANTVRPIRRLVLPRRSSSRRAAGKLLHVAERLVDRVAQNGCLVRQTSLAIKIDHQSKSKIARQVLGPTDSELLSFSVQVLIAKGRRIDGIEQLSQFADVYLNHQTLRGNGIACGNLIVDC